MGVVGLMLSSAGPVAAQSASRTLPQSVMPGSQFNVTVDISGVAVGSLVETLPAGFSYVAGSGTPALSTPTASGQDVTFTLIGISTISYSVTASDVAGVHGFSGTLSVVAVAKEKKTN